MLTTLVCFYAVSPFLCRFYAVFRPFRAVFGLITGLIQVVDKLLESKGLSEAPSRKNQVRSPWIFDCLFWMIFRLLFRLIFD